MATRSRIYSSQFRFYLVGRKEKWEDRKWGEDRKYFSFPHLRLVGRVEKWRDEKLFIWLRRKMRRLKRKFV